MGTQRWTRGAMLIAAICMLWGVGRATSQRFTQERDAFLKLAVAERGRLKLSYSQLAVQYPTPEIALCQVTKVAPGGTAQITLSGKFTAGTKFLYETDAIEVVSQNVTPLQYRGVIRAAQDALPCVATLHAISPVSGATAICRAVYVGAMPDWEFTAGNGWIVRLVKGEEKIPPQGGGEPRGVYVAEFYRKGEAKPFESFPAHMSLADACPRGNYTVQLRYESEGVAAPSGIEEYQKIAQQMANPKITPQEYEKLLARMSELATKMQSASENMNKQISQQAELGMRLEKFGCKELEFTASAAAASGNLTCYDANTGAPKEVKITGGAKPRKP